MADQQNTNQSEPPTQPPAVAAQASAPIPTFNTGTSPANVPPAISQPLVNPSQPKEKFQLFYVQDRVVSMVSAGRARFTEIFFSFIVLISIFMVKAALTPASYKHFNAITAYTYVLSAAIVSFIIFFILMSAYTRKKAGQPVSSTHRKLPSSLLTGVIGVDIAIGVNHSLQSKFSADKNTYVMGAIGAFMGIMCVAFVMVMHEVIKRIHSYQAAEK
jgi:tellurite resistance protein TehA-like permease